MINNFLAHIMVYPVHDGYVVRWSYKSPINSNVYRLYLLYAVQSHQNIQLEEDVTGRFYYKLPLQNQYAHNQRNQYVALKIKSAQEEYVSAWQELPIATDPLVEYLRKELKAIYLRRGTPAAIYNQRWGGNPCPRCFNPALKQASDPACPVCYGTGWEGGYFAPVETQVIIVASPTREFISYGPVNQPKKEWVLRIGADTPVSQGDVIYLPIQNTFVKVGNVTDIKYYSAPVLQHVVASELPPQHPVRNLDVPQIDIKPIRLAPTARDLEW